MVDWARVALLGAVLAGAPGVAMATQHIARKPHCAAEKDALDDRGHTRCASFGKPRCVSGKVARRYRLRVHQAHRRVWVWRWRCVAAKHKTTAGAPNPTATSGAPRATGTTTASTNPPPLVIRNIWGTTAPTNDLEVSATPSTSFAPTNEDVTVTDANFEGATSLGISDTSARPVLRPCRVYRRPA